MSIPHPILIPVLKFRTAIVVIQKAESYDAIFSANVWIVVLAHNVQYVQYVELCFNFL